MASWQIASSATAIVLGVVDRWLEIMAKDTRDLSTLFSTGLRIAAVSGILAMALLVATRLPKSAYSFSHTELCMGALVLAAWGLSILAMHYGGLASRPIISASFLVSLLMLVAGGGTIDRRTAFFVCLYIVSSIGISAGLAH